MLKHKIANVFLHENGFLYFRHAALLHRPVLFAAAIGIHADLFPFKAHNHNAVCVTGLV